MTRTSWILPRKGEFGHYGHVQLTGVEHRTKRLADNTAFSRMFGNRTVCAAPGAQPCPLTTGCVRTCQALVLGFGAKSTPCNISQGSAIESLERTGDGTARSTPGNRSSTPPPFLASYTHLDAPHTHSHHYTRRRQSGMRRKYILAKPWTVRACNNGIRPGSKASHNRSIYCDVDV